MEVAVAPEDTLNAPPQRPAVHILKADTQWWVLHWAHRALMAAQAYTPEVDKEDFPQGRQWLPQSTLATGWEGAP